MGAIHRPEGSEDKMTIVVVATPEEYKLAKERFKGKKVIQTGVGGINVIQKLRKIPKWVKIINFGYVGSAGIPVGTEIIVGYCGHYHKTEYSEEAWELEEGKHTTWCLTSDEFVEEYTGAGCPVFDMELAYICALGFKKVRSIKIVSDNLSLEQYEEEMK